jgi:DNA repair exonuclease SbcCD ATPase subunit
MIKMMTLSRVVMIVPVMVGCSQLPIPIPTFPQRPPQPRPASNPTVDERAEEDERKLTEGGTWAGKTLEEILRRTGKSRDIPYGTGTTAGRYIGSAIGKKVADDRRRAASEADYLDKQIEERKTEVSTKESKIAKAESELQHTRSEIDELEKKHQRNQNVSSQARRKIAEIDRRIEDNQKEAAKIQNSIDYIKEALRTSEAEAAAGRQNDQALQDKRSTLRAQQISLQDQYASILRVNEEYRAERNRLAAMRND